MAMAQASTEQCKHCDEIIDEFHTPGYCSDECYHKHKADKALDVIRHDHTLCATCLTPLKQVESPTEDWSHEKGSTTQVALQNGAEYHYVDGVGFSLDATECYRANPTSVDSVIGFEYREPDAETVIREIDGPDEWTRIEQTGTGCSCGQTDPSISDNDLKDTDPARILANYVKMFNYLKRTGKTSKSLDKDVFFETFKETRDWDYALGKAIE